MMKSASNHASRPLPAAHPQCDPDPLLSIRINNLMHGFQAGLISFDQWAAQTARMLASCGCWDGGEPTEPVHASPAYGAGKPKRAVLAQPGHVYST